MRRHDFGNDFLAASCSNALKFFDFFHGKLLTGRIVDCEAVIPQEDFAGVGYDVEGVGFGGCR
jgi:hypothetical protein